MASVVQDELTKRLAQAKDELQTAQQNLAREKVVAIYGALCSEFRSISDKVAELEREIARQTRTQTTQFYSVDAAVDSAMALLDKIERLTINPESREAIRPILESMGCKIGLTFKSATKGNTRQVRVLAGGKLAFGVREFPVPGPGMDTPDLTGRNLARSDERTSNEDNGHGKRKPAGSSKLFDPAGAVPNQCHREGISLSKVSRGERIRTSDLLVPNQAL